jgi:hypothetical protein
MFPRLFVRRLDATQLETKVREFGQPDYNPVRDEIARLREQRDAGQLSETDFATRVAELLGSADSNVLFAR